MSQPDTWLLIYGGANAKLVVASNTALLLVFSNVKIKFMQIKGFWLRIKVFAELFKRWKVLSYEYTTLLVR